MTEIVASAEEITVPVGTSTTTLTYDYLDDGTIEITGCDENAAGELEIPSEIDGVAVTSVGDKAFYECFSLTFITIPDSVTSIGRYAFECYFDLESVTIGSGVTII
ncbi:MAG: leucine-rich repeat domain-containing protein [Ruminococcus sp.]|nr:leucine-rich repeat domain-containing protein [Ruminococcus sp.]